MWSRSALCDRLDLGRVIVQAPMAGSTTPQLAAAVSNAGELGSLGLATTSVEQADQQIVAFKSLSQPERQLLLPRRSWRSRRHRGGNAGASAALLRRERSWRGATPQLAFWQLRSSASATISVGRQFSFRAAGGRLAARRQGDERDGNRHARLNATAPHS